MGKIVTCFAQVVWSASANDRGFVSAPRAGERKRGVNYLSNIFAADAFISPFNTQTMHIKSFYTQRHCYVPLKTL
jgi:hypothetical protein